MEKRKKTVIGILAHVDAGKTTLSEALLFCAGALRKKGRVDHRDTFLDTDPMERERGITIFSKMARFSRNDTDFILLDTPGHVDFSAETERTLAVLDYALLVISARDGVQTHTVTLWQLLQRYRIPTFLFVNKCDLVTPGEEALDAELRRKLSPDCFSFFTKEEETQRSERLALVNEELMESYLADGGIDSALLAQEIACRRLFPCFYGSALREIGVDRLLSALSALTLPLRPRAAFGAKVYKILYQDNLRLTFMKITGGSLRVREEILYTTADGQSITEKAAQLRLPNGTRYQPVEAVEAGEIVAVAGLTATFPGQGLGCETSEEAPFLEPVLTYRLVLPQNVDPKPFFPRLKPLEEEDPTLSFEWREETGEIYARLMGEVQIEILTRRIQERLGVDIRTDVGQILYKETIENTVEGVGHFEPLRHYAEVHLMLEPLPPGQGLLFASRCSENVLAKNWQRLILTHLGEKIHRGVLVGAPLTDVKITLLCGRAHEKHTEGGDFREATYRAVRQGLMQAQSRLLEPYYRFSLTLPAASLGRAVNDMERKGAEFEIGEVEEESATVTGRLPVSMLREYAKEVTAYTHGKGRLSLAFGGYAPCHNEEEVLAAADYHPENDTRNPPHSVFCKNGAGFTVPWDRVRDHMHLDSGFGKKGFFSPESILPSPASVKEGGMREKEWEALLQRTLGPIRRKEYREPKRWEAPVPSKEKPPRERVFIVDGYNLIFAWEPLKCLADESLEHARRTLMTLLSSYVAYTGCELYLVFDAYLVKDNPGREETFDGYRIIYTAEDETADTYIEKLMRRMDPHKEARVVTSDRLIQISALGARVLRMSAREFAALLTDTGDAIRSFLNRSNDSV